MKDQKWARPSVPPETAANPRHRVNARPSVPIIDMLATFEMIVPRFLLKPLRPIANHLNLHVLWSHIDGISRHPCLEKWNIMNSIIQKKAPSRVLTADDRWNAQSRAEVFASSNQPQTT